jgi:hypothetical protein
MTFTEAQNNKILATSVGKVIFNEIIPDSFAFINEPSQTNLEGILNLLKTSAIILPKNFLLNGSISSCSSKYALSPPSPN